MGAARQVVCQTVYQLVPPSRRSMPSLRHNGEGCNCGKMGGFQLADRCCALAIYSQSAEIPLTTVTSPAIAAPASTADPLAPAAIAVLRVHPRFAEAMRAAAAGMVAHYEGNRLLNQLMNDRGRVLFGHHAVYLHFSRTPGDAGSGLTVSA